VIGIKCWVYKGEVMAKGDQPVAPPAPTGDEVLAAKKVKKATPRPAPIAAEEKPEPVAAVKAAADAGSPAAAKPRARPQPVAAKKAGDAKAKAEAKPKTAVKKSRKPKTS